MTTNYKENLEKLSHQDLLRIIEITPHLVERMEVFLIGAKHSPDHNGPDGYFQNGNHVEVKTQKYTGNFTLRGRGKFGAPTLDLHAQKVKSNELIIVTGFDSDGCVYYRFSFTFDAIADRYLEAVPNKSQNYDFIPMHYVNHHSFKVKFIADFDILTKNKEIFQPKFFKFLMHLHENNHTQPTNFY